MRRHRAVNNAIVATDDVKIAPGKDFINWTPFITKKLIVKLPLTW